MCVCVCILILPVRIYCFSESRSCSEIDLEKNCVALLVVNLYILLTIVSSNSTKIYVSLSDYPLRHAVCLRSKVTR